MTVAYNTPQPPSPSTDELREWLRTPFAAPAACPICNEDELVEWAVTDPEAAQQHQSKIITEADDAD